MYNGTCIKGANGSWYTKTDTRGGLGEVFQQRPTDVLVMRTVVGGERLEKNSCKRRYIFGPRVFTFFRCDVIIE